jgi:BirA family biotin operon repressor/biotin-[acetyl-CoA-carboxylase] ligase
VSVLLRPALPVERIHLATLAAGLAALDALDRLGADASIRPGLKWPNDVVVDDRKLAGILAEADGAGAVVVGMGCNVQPDALPPDLVDIATAVAVDRAALLVAWLRAYDTRLDALDGVVADAVVRSATLGRRVRVELAHETFDGVATDLTDEGFLVVDGRVVSAGDVVHLRHDG